MGPDFLVGLSRCVVIVDNIKPHVKIGGHWSLQTSCGLAEMIV